MSFASRAESFAKSLAEKAISRLPGEMKGTFYLRSFGFFKVPLLFYTRPSVIDLTDQHCVVKIPLNRKTKNHLGSMYFGTLAIGADCAGGLMAMRWIEAEGNQASLVFKDFQAQFLRRPEGDVHFTCKDGEGIRDLVRAALQSGERQHMPVRVTATVPFISGDEPVAEFVLTLSVKKKSGNLRVSRGK